jgi:hypothetical protein
MASTKADNNRVSWTYTSDEPLDYTISAKAVYVLDATDGAKFGGEAGNPTDRRIPKEVKPRRVKCTAAGKPDKWIVAYDTVCDIWTTPGQTLTLDCNGLDVAYTSTRYKRAEKARDTTRQTA